MPSQPCRRRCGGRDLYEAFNYDALQRLTGSTLTTGQPNPPSLSVTYDGEGNITDKHTADGVLTNAYTYGTLASGCAGVAGAVTPGPHAVSLAGGTRYCYDRDGNVLNGGPAATTFSYTPYDLPATLVSASTGSKIGFEYGPNREKVRRLTYPTATATQATDITHYVGGAEVRYQNTLLTEVRRYVGAAVIVVQSGSGGSYAIQRQYLLTDAQGSTFAVLTDWGDPVNAHAAMSFDPFGLRRDPGRGTGVPWMPGLLTDLDATTHHGYTGHEEVESVGVIHMNGRLYDPQLGRFLQADPFVQDPYNSQSLNRYSYVLNNPMAFTDPTGYFSFGEFVRDVAAIAIIYYAPYLAPYLGGGVTGAIAAAAVGGFAAGAVQTGNLKGALLGAVSAEVFYGVNTEFPAGKLNLSDSASIAAYSEHALASGVAGGVMAQLQGGRFGAGFASAGFSAALAPQVSGIHSSGGQLFANAIIGGTASTLAGGKFGNGAVTASFSYAFGRIANGTEQSLANETGKKIDLSDVPSDDLRREMMSTNPAERLDAANAAVTYFEIEGTGYTLSYSSSATYAGLTNPNGDISLGPSAYYSWSGLGSTLGHEIEVHWNMQFALHGPNSSDQDGFMREVQAYDYNLNSAARFGNSPSEIQQMQYERSRYYGNLSRGNQQLVNKGIYYAPGW